MEVPMTTLESARQTIDERVGPTLATLQDNAREARRAIVRGQHAIQDAAADTALRIRRRPLTSVAAAGVAGALAGCVVGYFLGWHGRRTPRA
jgi:hypothetical protein